MKALPVAYVRLLRVGESVSADDLMQIGNPPFVSYSRVCTPQTCRLNREGVDCGGVGHVVEHSGERYWTTRS